MYVENFIMLLVFFFFFVFSLFFSRNIFQHQINQPSFIRRMMLHFLLWQEREGRQVKGGKASFIILSRWKIYLHIFYIWKVFSFAVFFFNSLIVLLVLRMRVRVFFVLLCFGVFSDYTTYLIKFGWMKIKCLQKRFKFTFP